MEEKINLTNLIFHSLNELLSKLFSSIDNSIYSLLDQITFIDSTILENTDFLRILGSDSTNGILLICNSLFFRFYSLLFYKLSYFSLNIFKNRFPETIYF